MQNRILFTLGLAIFGSIPSWAQFDTDSEYYNELKTITTSVPFLQISPDARAGGMGDVGASTSPDANSIHWNVAKLAFLNDEQNLIGLNYTPWLSRLVPDIDLAYVSYVSKIGKNQALGASIRYFSMGEINYTDANGTPQGTFNPYEFAVDIAYALKFSEQWSGGVSLRYIFSDLSIGDTDPAAKAGQSFATDLGVYYSGKSFRMDGGQSGKFNAGLAITNLGAKISYTDASSETDFIPQNLRLGGSFDWDLDKFNQFRIIVETNKLLVPTPPIREGDVIPGFEEPTTGDVNGNGIPDDGSVLYGKDDDVTFLQGAVQSFYDAPGGAKEEWREFNWNFGAEYWYDKTFAMRGGFQYEHPTKGNRRYFTLGAGFKYNVFQLDFAYLIPADATVRSPLENTLRFSLTFDFDALKE